MRAHENRTRPYRGLPLLGLGMREGRPVQASATRRLRGGRPPLPVPPPEVRRRRSARCQASRSRSPQADARQALPDEPQPPSPRVPIPEMPLTAAPASPARRAIVPRWTPARAAPRSHEAPWRHSRQTPRRRTARARRGATLGWLLRRTAPSRALTRRPGLFTTTRIDRHSRASVLIESAGA